jgi:hypothetical protein
MTTRFASNLRATVSIALLSVGLAACGDDAASSSGGVPATGSIVSPTVSADSSTQNAPAIPANAPAPPAASQGAPQISGKSVASINVGAKYQFVPAASGPAGSALTFGIQNKPQWASFDATTGTLSGTPVAADVGTYSNIVVSVSDGQSTAALAAFAVAVNQMSNGTATLDWMPPTENTDGSALTNLAGYKIYYGTSAGSLTESVKISNPGLSSYTVSNLSSGTWYFAVTAISSTGTESSQTAVVTASM